MHYSLHIIAIGNPRAHTIVAHNIAGNRNVSLHYAQSLLENFPVVYLTDVTKEDAEAALRQLTKIGVRARVVPGDSAVIVAPRGEEVREPSEASATSSESSKAEAASKTRAVSFIYKDEGVKDAGATGLARRGRLVAAAVVFLTIIIAAVFLAGQKWRLAVRPSLAPNGVAQGAGKVAPHIADAGDSGDSRVGRAKVSAQAKILAMAYSDSGKANVTDAEAVAFFKLAIGFNKYNIDAWYGLVNAYTRSGMTKEAEASREEMKKLFGGEVFSLSKIIDRFGALIDAQRTDEGTYRIEYRSRETDTAALVRETFQIVKAIGGSCSCAALSLYIHGNAARGVLVFITTDPPAVTFDQFLSAATIRRLE
jgi:hypothetical protein